MYRGRRPIAKWSRGAVSLQKLVLPPIRITENLQTRHFVEVSRSRRILFSINYFPGRPKTDRHANHVTYVLSLKHPDVNMARATTIPSLEKNLSIYILPCHRPNRAIRTLSSVSGSSRISIRHYTATVSASELKSHIHGLLCYHPAA